MLDTHIQNQLRQTLSLLDSTITLEAFTSHHEKQSELLEMLKDVASLSDFVVFKLLDETADIPTFRIATAQGATGISFAGIPGGHEFSSFILAILNSNRKGKFPDKVLVNRIAALKGPIKIRTVISLSCENCPDVVQNLNLMAILNPNFSHQMIDGQYIQSEIEKLGIQGVPSVLAEDTLISSGKSSLMDLIERLEAHFGTTVSNIEDPQIDANIIEADVTIIGAGPAGISAAIYTARKGLKTIIITDRVGGQLQDTKGIENFISVTYTEGPRLSAELLKHMQTYDISLLEHRRVSRIENNEVKRIHLNTGERIDSQSLIIATGAKWRELGVPGEKDYLGKGVAFCPHCDGPFYKGKDIAVVGGGNSGVEAAIDLAHIVKSVTLLEFAPELKADQVLVDKLRALPNVKIIANARTSEVLGNGEKVTGLQYEDRSTQESHNIELAGIFVQIGLIPNSELVKETVACSPYGEIIVDEKCRTNVPGIFAAGDVSTIPYKQIVIAMGEGAKAGLAAFEYLKL